MKKYLPEVQEILNHIDYSVGAIEGAAPYSNNSSAMGAIAGILKKFLSNVRSKTYTEKTFFDEIKNEYFQSLETISTLMTSINEEDKNILFTLISPATNAFQKIANEIKKEKEEEAEEKPEAEKVMAKEAAGD